jgi:hypothetical protein
VWRQYGIFLGLKGWHVEQANAKCMGSALCNQLTLMYGNFHEIGMGFFCTSNYGMKYPDGLGWVAVVWKVLW